MRGVQGQEVREELALRGRKEERTQFIGTLLLRYRPTLTEREKRAEKSGLERKKNFFWGRVSN